MWVHSIPQQISRQDGGFINGLASYTFEPGKTKIFHYGYYKKQVSLFLYDLQIAALLCGKCVFNRGIMYLLVSAAFKLPQTGNYDDNLLPYGPYASFVGKIYEAVVQHENDCKFGVNLLEYNNFSFGNKERMDFKIQVVYEAGPNSRFKKIIAPKLNVEKLVYISGFFDLNENELPFVEAKKIDLLDDYSNNLSQNQSNINVHSTFSRANKFRSNKHIVQPLV
ncbi:hypothetical protein GLOIN_2v1481254 [Rhizophagus irregularis DAOM 181602=DAOM 197198]|uniref:Uncharacterized protein n=2 Tax=Rhizophagus irregularis TaxID=588596 RepID=A0A2P4PR71_RHIID|nr:hypothetical protein GLOIN_2v1481254 [Rhizophagus irregularis DAOM 181602=DAOM 197198]POG67867.1 hypothetical protein GLOIN_2v1481254 [Rhizophagus irregularis DAOM 181602=DAOM 197198]|eukprot:XP_025174733.1 hypothetical protein GLOIN_2v1481254 [Rhizophagus irregularis DAOM 181602=DAOM 197198]